VSGLNGRTSTVTEHPQVRSQKSKTPDRMLRCTVLCTPVMGIGLWGLSPLCEIGISRRSVYQMTTSREQARGEGNCGRATSVRRVSPTSRSRLLSTELVKGELAQRKSMLLSGEICAAPGSKSSRRQKARNRPVQAGLGNAEVSRGRSTGFPIPMEPRKG